MRFKVVIPARYASTRLPAKPLLYLGGKPMVVRVAERALLTGAEEVVVATDHVEVLAPVERHGLRALLTRAEHASGTERLAEVVELSGWLDDTIVVNVQGDEPLINPVWIVHAAARLEGSGAQIATLAHPLSITRLSTLSRGVKCYKAGATWLLDGLPGPKWYPYALGRWRRFVPLPYPMNMRTRPPALVVAMQVRIRLRR